MAASTDTPPKSGLPPAPSVERTSAIEQKDLDDEARARENQQKYEARADANADNSNGPKWAAEAAKQQRIARTIRDKILEIRDAERAEDHERLMSGLGLRGHN